MSYVIVGHGPNSVEIPCLVFTSKEATIAYMNEHLGPAQVSKNGAEWWKADYDEKWNGDDEICKKFFTGYYGGCGGCYTFMLREVEEGKPFVRWDLD